MIKRRNEKRYEMIERGWFIMDATLRNFRRLS